jgi:hypothetical protein
MILRVVETVETKPSRGVVSEIPYCRWRGCFANWVVLDTVHSRRESKSRYKTLCQVSPSRGTVVSIVSG